MSKSDIAAISFIILSVVGAFVYQKTTARPEIPAAYRKCLQDTKGEFLYCEQFRGPR